MNTRTNYILCLPILLSLLTGCLSDIRPPSMLTIKPNPKDEELGRKLLKHSTAVYGDKKELLNAKVARATFTDIWQAPLARLFAMHWDENGQEMEIYWETGTNNARVKVLDGDSFGKRFGLFNGTAYESKRAGFPFEVVDDTDYKFALPTVVYFLEFPFRIGSANVVRYIGDEKIEGKTYAKVFASWGTEQPQENIDQYIIYINKQNQRMERLHYTIREKFRFTSASCLYSDFKKVNSVLIPNKMTLVTHPKLKDDVFHEMEFSEIELGVRTAKGFFKPFTN